MGRGWTAYAAATGSLAFTGWGLTRMARFASSRHALPRVSSEGPPWPTTVTAIVPARDEAAAITACVAALCATGPELVEVVVVDDHSADETAARAGVAGDARVRVIEAPELRPGELGKPVACAAGARAARGEWLWFVDADVAVVPDALRRLLAMAEESRSSLVSALGRLATTGLGPSWLLPEVGLTLARRLSLDAVADPTAGAAFASGQCLLVRRAVYDDLGGHGAVSGEAVEDLALARLAATRGVAQVVALAPDAYTVRMYDSLGATWAGLLKNSAAVRGTAPADVLRELAWVGASVAPLWVACSRRAPAGARKVAAATWAAQVVASAGGRVVARVPAWPALGASAAEVALVANWAASARSRRTGTTVSWRGRDVLVG